MRNLGNHVLHEREVLAHQLLFRLRLLGAEVLAQPGLRGPRLVIGDFNEWTRGLATKMLTASLSSTSAAAPGTGGGAPGFCVAPLAAAMTTLLRLNFPDWSSREASSTTPASISTGP